MKSYSKSSNQVLKELSSSTSGLSHKQVVKNRQKYGLNAITKTKGKTLIKRICEALLEPMLIILEVAVAITVGVNVGKALKGVEFDFYECIGIIFAIALSVSLTVIMEGKSQKAFDVLNGFYDLLTVKVMREGKILTINQKDVVVGDVIYLEAGDKIVADGRLISTATLEIDESALTGESNSVKKFADVVLPEKTPLAEQKNVVFSGTFVTNGSGVMVVTAVGDNAEIGVIASELQVKNSISAPLQEKLNKLSKLVALLGGIASLFVLMLSVTRLFVTNTFCFDTLQDAFLSSIILIVASVPEGLPTTVAIALTLNVVKLYKSNALIKKLVAAETVGCVSVICSDKTGTLTENKLKVKNVVCSQNSKKDIAYNVAINSTADVVIKNGTTEYVGQATEACLLEQTKKLIGQNYLSIRSAYKVISRVPFSSEIKYMSTTTVIDNKTVTFFKGAPEVLLEKCTLNKEQISLIKSNIQKEQESQKRVIVFAHKEESDALNALYYDGYAVMADSVRKDVLSSVKDCKKANIGVKMLTGDNYLTAYSIAKELDIASNKNQVAVASDLETLNDEELKEKLKNITVIARSTPKFKLKVVRLLKEMGEIVAVTGDGINDAPAIKHADIGISMGAGSEITKEASDIVLLDNSFSTIVKAISFGRNIYQNFQRFIKFQLSVNLTAVLFIIVTMLLGFKNPFSTLQLLWINLIMDGPLALTLALEQRGFELMDKKPVKRNDNIVSKKMLASIVFNAFFMCFALVLQYQLNYIDCSKNEMSTVIFSLFTFFQLFNAFNSKELGSKSVFSHIFSNKIMLVAFLTTFVLHVLLCQFFGGFFETVPLSFTVWFKTILTAFSIIILSEISKFCYRFICLFKKNDKVFIKTLIKSKNNA